MIIYLTISCITLCFCVITYLWVRRKRKIKKAKWIKEKWVEIMTERSSSVYGDYPNRDYFIPLREYKEDFLPKYKMRYHTLVEPIAYYSEDECGSATFCNDCYDTTDYDSL